MTEQDEVRLRRLRKSPSLVTRAPYFVLSCEPHQHPVFTEYTGTFHQHVACLIYKHVLYIIGSIDGNQSIIRIHCCAEEKRMPVPRADPPGWTPQDPNIHPCIYSIQ